MSKKHIGIFVVIIVGAISLMMMFAPLKTQALLKGETFIDAYYNTQNAVLLDVRTPSEYTAGHLAGAVNLDFESATFVSKVEELDSSKSYFVYCRSGNRSKQAIAIMRQHGIENVTELSGGIIANQNLELVTGLTQ